MGPTSFQVGDLVRIRKSHYGTDRSVIWRVQSVHSDSFVSIIPVFGLFSINLTLANRDIGTGELEHISLVQLGIEYQAFTDFLVKASKP